jgi:tetratricopeptide (TPR) repeat protein
MSLHRLVQAVTRQLGSEQQHQWATAALRLLRAAFPNRLGDVDAWPDYARLLPHTLAVIDHAEAQGIDILQTTWLLREAGAYLSERADYEQARQLFERALALDEAHFGADHPVTIQNLSNLANVLADEGDLAGARRLHERALAIYEARLGPDHPDTARGRRDLAVLTAELDKGP